MRSMQAHMIVGLNYNGKVQTRIIFLKTSFLSIANMCNNQFKVHAVHYTIVLKLLLSAAIINIKEFFI